jgi:hypothetical protein
MFWFAVLLVVIAIYVVFRKRSQESQRLDFLRIEVTKLWNELSGTIKYLQSDTEDLGKFLSDHIAEIPTGIFERYTAKRSARQIQLGDMTKYLKALKPGELDSASELENKYRELHPLCKERHPSLFAALGLEMTKLMVKKFRPTAEPQVSSTDAVH